MFGPFFGAKLLSTAGAWIHNIVAAILAFELSGSALVVGLVSVAQQPVREITRLRRNLQASIGQVSLLIRIV